MLFSSTVFIFLFLPGVLFGYYILFRKSRKLQNLFLTICSLVFYAWGEPKFVLVMIGSILMNWIFALLVDKHRMSKKKITIFMTLMIMSNIGILFVFKYLMFTVSNINNIFGMKLSIPKITLPIGISFFTFQAMSYVIDVYRKNGEVQKNPMNVALYIAFFPQLIAGPIVRYETIAEQIKNRKETFDDFADGTCRFIVGLGKKVLISNTLAIVADRAFLMSSNNTTTVAMAWLGAVSYTFQIYYDFSGYSDMAIGLGKMFGFKFLENFNYPYISKSISEFWRRWHISLGSWFRDYVYFPLGGSRVTNKSRLVLNLFVVWFLTGVWHGANWTFIIWGLMYFVLITLEKLSDFENKLKKLGILKYIYTMFFVILGWVIFRSNNLVQAITYIGNMFGIGVTGIINDQFYLYFIENRYFFLCATLFSMPITRVFTKKIDNYKIVAPVYIIILMLTFIISISYIFKGSYNPFIYFNF
ncbi:MBOAT family O-acyltransferase [Clostridium cadaveris]|uniref:Alginate O-acetyltransferase complex protein AlgI n=2 Tax=Clostridium cadaveris TaxID=1529 RepID=A0A1I2K1X2_9CLOT|nr:MBOAT family protein [Clostridium cadaveris]MDY4948245.1 MBOAT family protein [Clostridium cadaveris]SFF60313.1 alginate O-acetyltransferase complex protein AlgI [Clostridium cadaveris]